MADYGDATITKNDDGTFTVVHADDVIGISVQLLAEADPAALRVTSEGHLSMGSDGLTLYRPVRFDPASGTRVLICERVTPEHRPQERWDALVREATAIRQGDHLIVRVEGALTAEDAAEIKKRLMVRLPLLADVTLVRANGLYVFRDGGTDV